MQRHQAVDQRHARQRARPHELRPSVSVAAPRIGATMISVAAEAEPMYASVLVAFAVPRASTMNGAAVSAVTARLRT